ncbi:MAG TPA: hypothetical protein VFK03_01180 [Candidatus Saccharimonadales bacterium]|nr:hypothetical protein [Candidatus Saccharimonadales bacterium]
MSKSLTGVGSGLTKVVSALTSVATVLSLAGFAAVAPMATHAAVPSDYGLKEGQMISASGSNDPDIYIVNDWGFKRLFLNPVIFNMYGQLTGGFAAVTSVTTNVRDAFPTSGLFRDCEVGSANNNGNVYAVEVTGEDTGVLHHVALTGDQAVSQDANFFKKVFCINDREFNWYQKGSDYTSLSQVPVYTRGTTPTPTGSLSVSLASDNPASGTLIEGQALADLGHFNVNGSGVVTSVEFQRLGISGDTTLSDVYLFVNGVRVSDAGSVSNGKVTFTNGSGLFTAPAMVSLRSDIASSTSGQTVGIAMSSINGMAVSASGNLQTIASSPGNLSTLSFTAPTGPGSTIDPQADVNVWQSIFTVGNKDVWMKRLALREIGSVNYSDIHNFRLFVDGTQVATASNLDANGYVTFLMGSGYALTTNGTHTVKVLADVTGGASRTFSFSLRGAYDLEVVDSNVGVNISASGTLPATTSTTTINNATITTVKASDSPSADLVKGGTDASLAKFTMTGYGESTKIDSFTVTATTSDSAFDVLRNARILINGVQYGSTTNIDTNPSSTGQSFTVNYTLQPGTPVTVEVRADLKNSSGTDLAAGKTISVSLKQGSDNGQGNVSANLIDVPSSTVAGNTLSVVAGSMTLSKYSAFANQTTTVPRSHVKLGSYVLTGNSSEAVNVNTLDVSFVQTAATFNTNMLNNVSVVYNGTATTPKSTVTASNSFSANFTLAANQTMNIDIYGDISSTMTNNSAFRTSLNVTGTNATSGGSVSSGTVQGQTITAGTGSATVSQSNVIPAKVAAANTTQDALSAKVEAVNDNFTVKEATFKVADATAASAISSVILNGMSQPVTLLASGDYVAQFTGMSLPVNIGTPTILTAQVQLGNVGIGAASTAANVALTLTSVKVTNSSGTDTTKDNDITGNAIYVHKSYPSISASTFGTGKIGVLTTGSGTSLAKFQLSANNGSVALHSITLDLSRDALGTKIASTSSDGQFWINGSNVTSQGTIGYTGLNSTTTGTVTFTFTNEYTVAVGSPITIEFRPNVTAVSGTTASLTATMNVGTTSAAAPNTASAASGKLVWSDLSGNPANNTVHSSTTPDWMNDNLIRDAVSQTLATY